MIAQRGLPIERGLGADGRKRWSWDMDDRSQESDSRFPAVKKRRADDNLEGEQRLSKRFNLLNLEHTGKLYIPVQGNAPNAPSDPPIGPASNAHDDSMQVDDTKDKIYIHNLAAEIADLESDEETPLFLPDIEKKLSKIPQSVLTGRSPAPTSNQMVLYNVPSSLSVPEERDSVRRAIMDSRARAREKQAQEQKALQESSLGKDHLGNAARHDAGNNGFARREESEEDDAMDIG
ncbi:MAG: hypothetical protein Q9208_005954 [Pyrenodesmia sp. 3 TL-2023]